MTTEKNFFASRKVIEDPHLQFHQKLVNGKITNAYTGNTQIKKKHILEEQQGLSIRDSKTKEKNLYSL